jgi:hypothetical protein
VKPVVSGLVCVAIIGALCTAADAQPTMKLGEVLVFTPADAKATAPHAGAYLFSADRGSRKGERVFVSPAAKDTSRGDREVVYRLVSPQSAGMLPDVDVLGMHYVKVRPERSEAFERFIAEKVHPAVANLRPDLRILYYKSARGPDGNYVALFALTKASRDKYWPKGSDSDELRAAFTPAVKALTKELSSYLVEGSYAADPKLAAAVYESREWTDYVLVKE